MTEIRVATKNDTPTLLNLLVELGRPQITDYNLEKFEELISQYLQDSDKTILVADDSKVVGLVAIMFLKRLNQEKLELYIPELVVQEDSQGQEIGRKLIDETIILAKKNDCYRIRLESGNFRKGSHQFYKHLGFEQSGLSFSLEIDLRDTN